MIGGVGLVRKHQFVALFCDEKQTLIFDYAIALI